MAEVVLLDTGPLVAVLDRREASHAWASDQLHRLRIPLITCGAVISETMFLVRDREPAPERLRHLIESGTILSVHETEHLWSKALHLLKKYDNVPMSFADACLVALSETFETCRVFTLDRDFLIYRRNERDAVPLLAPFVH